MTERTAGVEAFLDKLRDLASTWDAHCDELETMRVTGTSPDGVATATCDSGGVVVDLEVHAGLRDLGERAAADSLLRACAAAVEEANSRRAALVSEAVSLALDARAGTAHGPRAAPPWPTPGEHG